jgi:hypothetical protein
MYEGTEKDSWINVLITQQSIVTGAISEVIAGVADLERAAVQTLFARMIITNISPEAVMQLTTCCPVMVIKTTTGFACVGNRRVLSMAKMALGLKKKITVNVLDGTVHDAHVRIIALVDTFVLPLLYTVEGNSQAGLKRAAKLASCNSANTIDRKWVVSSTKKRLLLAKNIMMTDKGEHGFDYRFSQYEWLTPMTAHVLMLLSPPWGYMDDAANFNCIVNRNVCEVVTNVLDEQAQLLMRVVTKKEDISVLKHFETSMAEPTHLLWKYAELSIANIFRLMNKKDLYLVFNQKITYEMLANSLGFRREPMFNRIKPPRIQLSQEVGLEDLCQYHIGRKENYNE